MKRTIFLLSLVPIFSGASFCYGGVGNAVQPFPESYINKDGFVTIEPNANPIPGEGNGWLQTGLAVATGKLPANPAMLSCCRKSPSNPLIWRSPYKINPGDETQADDYWGALVISPDWAREVYFYASAHHWNFDIGGKNRLEYWFARFWGFTTFMRLCADLPLVPEEESLLIDVMSLGSIEDASGNMKTFLLLTKARPLGGDTKKAADAWIQRVREKYGTIGGSWAKYFGQGHPLNNYDGENLPD